MLDQSEFRIVCHGPEEAEDIFDVIYNNIQAKMLVKLHI